MLSCFVLVSTLVSTHCLSQSLMQGLMQRLQFGLKAGVNYSNFSNADFNTDALVGFHAGAIVGFKLTHNLSIQEEFLFSSEGAKVNEDLFGKNDVRVYYLDVPFLLKYRTNSGIYFEAGPQVGMLAKDYSSATQTGSFAQKLDLSAAAGLGYQTKSGFGIGVRYVYGLSKVGAFKDADINPNFQNSVAQASIFYIF